MHTIAPGALHFLKVYELGRGPLGGSPKATAPALTDPEPSHRSLPGVR